jgi:undecaprenyl-diphosphatase
MRYLVARDPAPMAPRKTMAQKYRDLARGEFLLICGIVAACLGLWAFLGVAEEMGEGEHDHFEEQILRSFRRPGDLAHLKGPTWTREVAQDISSLGGASVTVILTVSVAGYLLIKGKRREGTWVICAVAGGSAVCAGLKHVFDRPRPAVVPFFAATNDPSFPSGHSMTSAVVYLTLGVLMARSASGWTQKLFFLATGLTLSGLVGISRVMLGVHYPSDVVAGWSAGASWALLCWIVAEFADRQHKTFKQK